MARRVFAERLSRGVEYELKRPFYDVTVSGYWDRKIERNCRNGAMLLQVQPVLRKKGYPEAELATRWSARRCRCPDKIGGLRNPKQYCLR